MNYPTVYCHMGSYDFCHPNEKQMHYSLRLPDDAPKGLIRDFTLREDDLVTDDPIEAARWAVEHAENLWVCTNAPRYSELLLWLEDNEEEHEHARLVARQTRLQEELAKVQDRLALYPKEVEQ